MADAVVYSLFVVTWLTFVVDDRNIAPELLAVCSMVLSMLRCHGFDDISPYEAIVPAFVAILVLAIEWVMSRNGRLHH